MIDKFEMACARIRDAKRSEDLFGQLTGTFDQQKATLLKRYRMWATEVHPDHHCSDPAETELATDMFIRLNNLHDEANSRIDHGIYGSDKVTPKKATSSPPTILRKKQKIVVTEGLGSGDICTLHKAILSDERGEQTVFLKVALVKTDNDLVENESKTLEVLVPKGTKIEGFYRYLPTLIESFKIPQPGGPRQLNIFQYLEGYYSLEQIRSAYPDGLVMEDVVWMFNRMLEGIGFVHSKNIIHGAIIPSHVMIHPASHAAKFVDWSYSVGVNEKIQAISSSNEAFYPPEVFDKNRSGSYTDIYMIAKCAKFLAGNKVLPGYFDRFLEACFLSPSRRPTNAWDLRDEFDVVMKKYYGPRRYHKFVMP